MDQVSRIAEASAHLHRDLDAPTRQAYMALIRELDLLVKHLTPDECPCPETLTRLLIAVQLMREPHLDVHGLLDQWTKAAALRNVHIRCH